MKTSISENPPTIVVVEVEPVLAKEKVEVCSYVSVLILDQINVHDVACYPVLGFRS